MGSTISIIVAVVAVVLGFLILKNITNDSTSSNGGASGPVDTSGSLEVTTLAPPVEVTTTTMALVFTGATVLVANASGVSGTAGQFSKALGQVGFTMAPPTNAADPEAKIAISKVYYLPGGELVAATAAVQMGGVAVAPMPTPVPIKDQAAGLGEATVLVMLGSDLAGKALPALAGAPGATTVPPVGVVTTTTGG
jgi:hypothetical protein